MFSCCENLREIPLLPNLERLYCYNCVLIKEIPLLPKLSDIGCYNCPKLKEIPLLPELKSLECLKCPIKEIPLLPKLERIWFFSKKSINQYNLLLKSINTIKQKRKDLIRSIYSFLYDLPICQDVVKHVLMEYIV